VLELGAGLGDHTSFFLDRGCEVIVTEAREENLAVLRARYPGLDVRQLDVEDPGRPIVADIVYCYGLLYHLSQPAKALEWIEACDPRLLLLETCVSARPEVAVYRLDESATEPDNAIGGVGCRPTRAWVLEALREHFPHAYVTTTQPWHEEFPLDWTDESLQRRPLVRAVFIAAAEPVSSASLTETLAMRQVRH
jgi:hypothetical protein